MADGPGVNRRVAAVAAAPRASPRRGTLVEHVTCPSDPSQTYTLYLPVHLRQPTRHWPLLLVFDPGGRARAGGGGVP